MSQNKDLEKEELSDLTPINQKRSSDRKQPQYNHIPRSEIFRIFETVQDSNVEDFMCYLEKFSKIKNKILVIRNNVRRTLLHIACQRGCVEMVELLLKELKENGIRAMAHDENGDTPLTLAYIRGFGFSSSEDYMEKDKYPDRPVGQRNRKTSKRYQIVKRLIDFRNHKDEVVFSIKDACKPKKNTPLHWAIYWSDLNLVRITYFEFPAQIFMVNKDKLIPFDMCLECNSQFLQKRSMIIIYSLLDEIFSWLMKNLNNEDFGKSTKDKDPKLIQKRREIMEKYIKIKTVKQCDELIQSILNNETDEDYQELNVLFSNAEPKILNHQREITIEEYGKITTFVQRIILWYAFFQSETKFLKLIETFHISPFAISSKGMATIHLLCTENYHAFLKLILAPKYKYLNEEKDGVFDLTQAINVTTLNNHDTPLHLAAMGRNWRCFRLLHGLGADNHIQNYRGWVALQLADTKMNYFHKIKDKKKQDYKEQILNCDPIQQLLCSDKKLQIFDTKFQYCIIATADSANPQQTTVYKQLKNIQHHYKNLGKIKIEYNEGFSNNKDLISKIGLAKDMKDIPENIQLFSKVLVKESGNDDAQVNYQDLTNIDPVTLDKLLSQNHYIYKIKLNYKLMCALAKELDMRVYDYVNKYHTQFEFLDSKNYEPFRDIQIQQMITYIMNKEFSIEDFTANKLILEHFPIHHYRERNYIDLYWKKYFWVTIFGSFKTDKNDSKNIQSILQIAFYHGLQHGLYFGFLVQLTSFMAPLALIGLFFYIWGLADSNDGFDNVLSPWISVVISLWMTLFIEQWKRKEKYLAYHFDVLGITKEEKVRFEYTGNYVIDRLKKTIEKLDPFPTGKRRIFVDPPLLFLGALLVGATFVLFDWTTESIIRMEAKKELSYSLSLIYQ